VQESQEIFINLKNIENYPEEVDSFYALINEHPIVRNFIAEGIRVGRLEYSEETIWGNPYIRLLRSQLEQYIAEERGTDYLLNCKKVIELRMIKKEIAQLKKRLKVIESRKNELKNQN